MSPASRKHGGAGDREPCPADGMRKLLPALLKARNCGGQGSPLPRVWGSCAEASL